MTVGLSAANFANKALDVLSGTSFTAPAGAYFQVHTGDPGAAGTTSVSSGDATRKSVTFASAASGSKSMNGTNPVWTNGGTSETLTHVSLWSASSAGSFMLSGSLTSSKAWASGDTFTLTSFTISLAPIAA
jgi:hypothetical protein